MLLQAFIAVLLHIQSQALGHIPIQVFESTPRGGE